MLATNCKIHFILVLPVVCYRTHSIYFRRSISLGPSLNSFAENHPKGRYKNINKPSDTRRDRIRMGLKQLKQEIKVWTEEVKDALEFDPVMTLPLPGLTF